jgi:hypothetical protein
MLTITNTVVAYEFQTVSGKFKLVTIVTNVNAEITAAKVYRYINPLQTKL